MAVSLLPAGILSDVFDCLGLGLLIALVRDLLATEKSKILLFLTDILSFAAAAILLQAYAAGLSLSGIPRGYMAAAMLLGIMVYHSAVVPLTRNLRFWICWLCSRPFCLTMILFQWSTAKLYGGLKRWTQFCREKSKKS